MALLSTGFLQTMKERVKEFGYLDTAQEELMALFIEGAAAKLLDAGVPVQESAPAYQEAIIELAAYRYFIRGSLNTSLSSKNEDRAFQAMVWDYVHRLRCEWGGSG